MNAENLNHISHALRRAERILLVLKTQAHLDDVATAYALTAALRTLDKPVDIVMAGGKAPEALQFLKTAAPLLTESPQLRSLVVRLNIKNTPVQELSYAVNGDELRIHVLPQNGAWKREDVTVATTGYRYDLVITIGTAQLASLGTFREKQADFLFETPILNIDHTPENEHFGQWNLVDTTATSSGEVIAQFLTHLDEKLITKEIATSLLTGMVAKTKSFRTPNVTPKTLAAASSLIEKGADRETIIEHLYRTRSVDTLKLWGKALARLQSDPALQMVWTSLSAADLPAGISGIDAIRDVIDELISSAPEAKTVLVFLEKAEQSVEAHLFSSKPLNASNIPPSFTIASDATHASTTLSLNLKEAETMVLNEMRRTL